MIWNIRFLTIFEYQIELDLCDMSKVTLIPTNYKLNIYKSTFKRYITKYIYFLLKRKVICITDVLNLFFERFKIRLRRLFFYFNDS